MRKKQQVLRELKEFLSELENIEAYAKYTNKEEKFNELKSRFYIFRDNTSPQTRYEPASTYVPKTDEQKIEKLSNDITSLSRKIKSHIYEVEKYGVKQKGKGIASISDRGNRTFTFFGMTDKITKREAKFIFYGFITAVITLVLPLLGIMISILLSR